MSVLMCLQCCSALMTWLFFPLLFSNSLVLSASALLAGPLPSSCPWAGGLCGNTARYRNLYSGARREAWGPGSPPPEPLEVSVAPLKRRRLRPRGAAPGRRRGRAGGGGPRPARLCRVLLAAGSKARTGRGGSSLWELGASVSPL